MVVKTFEGALKLKVNYSKPFEVTGKAKGEILAVITLTAVTDWPTAHAFVTPLCKKAKPDKAGSYNFHYHINNLNTETSWYSYI